MTVSIRGDGEEVVTGRGASGGKKGSGPREDPSTHSKLLQRAMKKERPMQSGGARGLSRETIQTLFPMTSAALEKKKKGEKKICKPTKCSTVQA